MLEDRLAQIPLFASLSKRERAQVARAADEVEVPEGKRLVEQGRFAYEFVAIEEGTAEVVQDGKTIAQLGPGDFFGEIGLLERDRRTATVVAKTPMKLVTLTGWDLKRMEKAMPEAVEKVRAVIEERRPPTAG